MAYTDTMYDLCIIGAGMIGSSAARHATLSSDNKVCLIGPPEPKERSKGNNCDIYGAYYDEARITRSCSSDVVWAKLALESIRRYRDIEAQSGIHFYNEVGNIMTGCGTNSSFLKSVRSAARQSNVKTESLDSEMFRKRFPYFKVPDNVQAELETTNAGFINPRKMVEAEQKLACQQECTLIDDVVHKVDRIVCSDGTYAMKVVTDRGSSITARKVLLTTGAFTNFRQLVPYLKFDFQIIPRLVVLAEVDFSTDAMKQLRSMPCFIYEGPPHRDWKMMDYVKGRQETSLYVMPPVKYPDGKYYIKAGILDPFPIKLTTQEEVKQWYDEGNKMMGEHLKQAVQSIFNGIQFKNWRCDTCCIMKTPTDHPYIDKIHDQLGVAIGGNGRAAKSCDEIARIAVSMMLHGWTSELPQHEFTMRTLPVSKL